MTNTVLRTRVRAITESAVLIAMAFALSWVKFELPQGGSVTAVSMLPILLIGIRRGALWGIASAVIYSLLQMLQAFYAPPVTTLVNYFLVVALDYVIAFGVLGLSFIFRRAKNGLLIAVPVCLVLRFLCHFFSGVLIWGPFYAWDGWGVWPYSLAYNGAYMGIELVLTCAAAFALMKTAPRLCKPQIETIVK